MSGGFPSAWLCLLRSQSSATIGVARSLDHRVIRACLESEPSRLPDKRPPLREPLTRATDSAAISKPFDPVPGIAADSPQPDRPPDRAYVALLEVFIISDQRKNRSVSNANSGRR